MGQEYVLLAVLNSPRNLHRNRVIRVALQHGLLLESFNGCG
jgi:hypothetical protein